MKKVKVIVMGILFSLQTFGAGDGSTGGADLYNLKNYSAWITGEQEITKICFEADPAFPYNKSSLKPMVEGAYSKWTELYKKSRWNEFLIKKFRLSLNFQVYETCDNLNPDIRILFGVSHSKYLASVKNLESPLSFGHPIYTDPSTGRKKGIIWVANQFSIYPENKFPNWSLPYRLHAMLLHEFGHIFGMPHVEGTIMSEDFAHYLEQSQIRPTAMVNSEDAEIIVQARLSRIEFNRWIVNPAHRGFSQPGKLMDEYSASVNAQEAVTFERMMGRKPKGKIITTLSKKEENLALDAYTDLILGETTIQPSLKIKDDLGEKDFVLELTKQSTKSDPGLCLFKIIDPEARLNFNDLFSPYVCHSVSSFVKYGKIKGANEKSYNIIYEINQKSAEFNGAFPVAVRYLVEKENGELTIERLFYSYYFEKK